MFEFDKQYKEAVSSDERAKILPELEAAEKAYDEAADKLASQPLTWKGMAKDIKELSEFYNKADFLEDKINSGKIRLPDERPPKAVRRPSKAQKKAVVEARAAEEAKAAAERATAPKTSGEALTRSQAQKARKAEKTLYSSKGVGQAGLTKQDEARLEMLRQKIRQTINQIPKYVFVESPDIECANDIFAKDDDYAFTKIVGISLDEFKMLCDNFIEVDRLDRAIMEYNQIIKM